MLLIYSPDDTNVYGPRTTMFQGSGSVYCRGWKLYNRVPRRHFLFSCSDTFGAGCNHLATMHRVTDGLSDRQTDRQTERQTDDNIMPIADHTACSTIY